ncbi:hypothetical protein JTB14_021950 [Gonioctena quinquepunctata]|nr:hypothetical protein JTB14_021950 [Gonioctena quinquepunctata]
MSPMYVFLYYNSYIKGNRLYVNNRAYTAEELEENENTDTTGRKPKSAPSTPTSRNIHPVIQSETDKNPTEENTGQDVTPKDISQEKEDKITPWKPESDKR